jgi:hypothetical protein
VSRSVRPCVRVCVTKRLGFGALDGVRAPSPRLLYSVGDCSMIQLNDSESLVSVQQVFSDHRARALALHTNLVRSPCMGPNPYSGSERLGGGWDGPKSRKIDFCHIAQFWSSGSYRLARHVLRRPPASIAPPDRPEPFTAAAHSWICLK